MAEFATVTTTISPTGVTTCSSPRRQVELPVSGAGTLGTELRGLAELHNAGHISQHEFEHCKRMVIARHEGRPAPTPDVAAPPPAPTPPAEPAPPVAPGVTEEPAAPPPSVPVLPVQGQPAVHEEQHAFSVSPTLTGPHGALSPPVAPDDRVWRTDGPETAVYQPISQPPVGVAAAPAPEYAAVQPAPAGDYLAELHARKAQAVANEDYQLAKDLKAMIEEEEARRAAQPPAELRDLLQVTLWSTEGAGSIGDAAASLAERDPGMLLQVLGSKLPGFTPGKIQRNWQAIVEVYKAHAERAAEELSAIAAADTADDAGAVAGADGGDAAESVGAEDPLAQIKGVIEFLDAPLSPNSLRDVRLIRRGCSPRRGRTASPL
eukprot:TRINITY_DN5785_c0_g6_i1.p1 TRINITY_DN5785_c0_g6~~TRINITY_DN5785_c0_g6_i1.p1  ORF type:complete len:392 (+),score=98.34 TRINITY_DN5785_c0_g6_i1:48-1178(+)